MAETKFTPGPWGPPQRLENALKHRIDCAGGGAVADVWGLNEEAVANARLTAAAPALYEALEKALPELGAAATAEKRRNLAPVPVKATVAQERYEAALAALSLARGES